jgi:hypothetical protein
MLQIALQLVAACALFAIAVHIHLSLRQRRNREWLAIMENFVHNDCRSALLSYRLTVSADIACPDSEIWSQVGGVHGFWTMYLNTEVLLDAVEYTLKTCGQNRPMAETLQRIREEILDARRMILVMLLKCFLTALRRPALPSISATARAYIASVAHLGLALNDFRPDLLRPFRFYIART